MEWGADTAAQPNAGFFLAFHTYSTRLSYLTRPSAIHFPTPSFLAQLHATLSVLCVLICEIQPGLSNPYPRLSCFFCRATVPCFWSATS